VGRLLPETETAQGAADAIFVPGRLLGTSESFCVKSQTEFHQPRTTKNSQTIDSTTLHLREDVCDQLTDDDDDADAEFCDAFDNVASSLSSPSPVFIRETRIRRRPNIRSRPPTDHHAAD